MAAIAYHLVDSLFAQVGLTLVGVTGAESLGEPHRRSLALWQEQGFGADMHYLYRDPELLVAAQNLMPEGRTVVMVAAPYDAQPVMPTKRGHGKVARYAWGRDYHRVLPRLLHRFAGELRAATGDTSIAVRAFADAIPLLERPYAARSGLGFIGKHSLLIRPGVGSFFLLGGAILDREVTDIPPALVRGGCGTCNRCASKCPTGAIVSPYTVDARRCISYLTIEKRGLHSRVERAALGSWIFGCDECQEVCPHNTRALAGRRMEAVPGLEAPNEGRKQLELGGLLEIRTNEEFLGRFAGTPLMRPKREGLIRNGIAVGVNTQYDPMVPQLEICVREDPSEVVRATSLWAILALSPGRRLALEPVIARDPSQVVQTEWRQAWDHHPEIG